ncbi:type I secretion system permease/ATPase [Anaplasma capra]|uniref:type I secretion system permease/ATPase n=1 Tax=Anaplasma capra TaxID=1562740 RepID=UPI0021D5D28F|nr:type I secretion system permease/ATPase [Anaplasma capra]MCU7612765.1 type I secretion system permease/ATPase [Anaplasma capra]
MKELKKSVLYQTLEKCKSVFWFVFWFSSAINVLVLFLPLYTSQVLDRVLSSGSSSTLLMLSLVTVGALICSSLLDVCRSLTMAKVADWIDGEATPDLISRSISLTSIKASTSSGEAIRDLGVVKGFITGFGVLSLFDMPWAVVYLVAIFMIHPVTGYIAVVGIALLVLMAIWNELATKQVMQESNEENVRNINYIDVASRNAEVVEAMGMVKHIVAEWSGRNTHNRKLQVKAQGRSNVIMGITKFVRSVLQISVIGVGAWLAIHGHKTAGGIIAASILMGRALAPFEAAINTWKMLLSARISYRRLQTLLLSFPRREQAMALPTPKGSVSMERVFFTPYGGSKPTIKGVSFGVEPGSVVGIIGPSASGKSTLVKLLVGVWKPLSGVVRLDGADVYTWNREDFGCHVGYLPQDIELFQASVKTNIARMMPNPDPEKVVKAAKIAGIHEMILRLPSGYDTIIGNNGVILSGGQKQMLGLARAFYGDVRLLVLDEPNANLDGRAEASLVQALAYARQQGITTFVVTHKMQLLSAVEQVIVMDDGMMAAMGDRNEILSRFTTNKPPASREPDERRGGSEAHSDGDSGPARLEARHDGIGGGTPRVLGHVEDEERAACDSTSHAPENGAVRQNAVESKVHGEDGAIGGARARGDVLKSEPKSSDADSTGGDVRAEEDQQGETSVRTSERAKRPDVNGVPCAPSGVDGSVDGANLVDDSKSRVVEAGGLQ